MLDPSKKVSDETIQLPAAVTEKLKTSGLVAIDSHTTHVRSAADEATTLVGASEENPATQQANSYDQATLAAATNTANLPKKLLAASETNFGDYRIEAEIARGGMGVVYKARQISLNRPVAIKMILSGNLAGQDDVRRFYVEAEAAAKLEHPNIVPIYEIGQHKGQHFFSMGYVDGGSLDKLITDNTLPASTAVELMVLVCDAIQFAHEQGIVHRDLKPANILLTKGGLSRSGSSGPISRSNSTMTQRVLKNSSPTLELDWIPKVSDFGLAKQLNSKSELTGTGQILGTPSYMPPEQADGTNGQIGPLADVYSLGAVLYRTLTGRPPFQSSSPMETIMQLLHQEPIPPRQLNPAIPVELETVCLKCLQKDPSKRYGSAQELGDDLTRWLRGDPILARPMSSVAKTIRWVRKHPAICGSALVVMAAVASVVVVQAKANRSLVHERDLAIQAQQEASEQQALAQSRLTRAIESIDLTTKRVTGNRWSMDPALQEERRALIENAIHFYSGLIEDESDTEYVRVQAIRGYEQMAHAKFRLNDVPGAMESCRLALELSQKLIDEQPQRHDYVAKHVDILAISGSVTAFSGDLKNGLDLQSQAVQLVQSLAGQHPEIARYQWDALESMCHYAYFVLSSAPELRDTGRGLLEQIKTLAEKLEKTESISSRARLSVAFAWNVCGSYLLNGDEADKGKSYFERSMKVVNDMMQDNDQEALQEGEFYHVRGMSAINLGVCCLREEPSQVEAGLKSLEEGLESMNAFVQIHPNTFVYKMQLLQALGYKLQGQKILGKDDEALETQKEIDRLKERLAKENADSPWVTAMQSADQSLEVVTRIRNGDVEGAEEALEKLLEAKAPNRRAMVVYNVLCGYSQAMKFTTNDEVRERYWQKIQTLLDELKRLGHFNYPQNVEHAIADPDLAPIIDRVDFKSFSEKP